MGTAEAYRCPACQREYPLVFGIPDFRLFPDPYISFEDEYEKARLLAEKAERLSFEALVRLYWEITPDVPQAAAERFIRFALSGEDRGKACLETVDAHGGGHWSGQACLEMGCGTGGFLLAARQRFHTLVGADIALRWLVIAQKRLTSVCGHIILVCCAAEHLPFPDGIFDCVVGLHVLEHTQDQQAVLSETTRTLKRSGRCFFSTPNRFSLGPEPCVRVWGVGFVPRSLAPAYVWLIKGVPYRHIRLLSCFELRRLLTRSGLQEWTISPLRIAACEQQSMTGFTRVLIAMYHALLERPVFPFFLRLLGPLLCVVGRK
jgi:2-polyprenyl-3-methyl-5-hydroxy-6-metoxy-1,4-benzoquinol methylase